MSNVISYNLTYDDKLNLNTNNYDTVDMSVKVVLDQLEHKTRITKKVGSSKRWRHIYKLFKSKR